MVGRGTSPAAAANQSVKMADQRPTLFLSGVLAGLESAGSGSGLTAEQLASLRACFELHMPCAGGASDTDPGGTNDTHHEADGESDGESHGVTDGYRLIGPDLLKDPAALLQATCEGVVVFDSESGSVLWATQRFHDLPEDVRTACTNMCAEVAEWIVPADGSTPETQSVSFPVGSGDGEKYFDSFVTVLPPLPDRDDTDTDDDAHSGFRMVAVVRESTTSHAIQKRFDQIDHAGSRLLHLEADMVSSMSAAERLKLLEQKIVEAVEEVLEYDHFEVRLIDRESRQLELVIAKDLPPLKIGEVIFAAGEDNGICGWVADTGMSYICSDAVRDDRYIDGLENPGSSLTVPLRMFDRVIGVFNVESHERNAFDDKDRRFTERFGHFIATAMHMLDLLVVERYTTNTKLSETVMTQLRTPLDAIISSVEKLRRWHLDAESAKEIDAVLSAAQDIDERLKIGVGGPKTIIGADAEISGAGQDPDLAGSHILVADNEPVMLRQIRELLERKGCRVTACDGGVEAIAQLRSNPSDHFDIVLSDIKMDDRNGYEVFRAAREMNEDIPVILMTGFGYDPHHSIVRATQEGLEHFLFKPIEADRLLSSIKGAMLGEEAAGDSSS